ncbi:hypothetical protein DRO69_07755 [Candidatus Bathyarchaeota archaeon]|nr:MAG: hypothetical protein DRO69_07755 [Candidatus Bathyarchaeota archaeon]
MRPSRKEIEKVLREAEITYNLRENVLSEIYNAEARVVFKGRRRGITSTLRRIIINATKEEEKTNEN